MKLSYCIGPFTFVFIWTVASYTELVNPVLIPTPLQVFLKLMQLIQEAAFLSDLLVSLYRLFIGFSLASMIAIPTGLIIGSSKRLSFAFEFPIDFLRSLPASALFPVFLLFFGMGDKSKIAVVTFSCALIILVNTIYGVKNSSPARIAVAKIMRAGRYDIFTKVIFPESLPHIFSGLRISVSIGLILVVVTEMFIGSETGLGQRIYDSQLMFRIPEMYATILTTGVLGYLLNRIFIVIETRYFHWIGH